MLLYPFDDLFHAHETEIAVLGHLPVNAQIVLDRLMSRCSLASRQLPCCCAGTPISKSEESPNYSTCHPSFVPYKPWAVHALNVDWSEA